MMRKIVITKLTLYKICKSRQCKTDVRKTGKTHQTNELETDDNELLVAELISNTAFVPTMIAGQRCCLRR